MKGNILLIVFLLIIVPHPLWASNPVFTKAIYSRPETFDPIKANEGISLMVSELLYEGLLRFDNNFGVKPGLAESWKTSLDGKVLTFVLKNELNFSDGKAIDSEAVVRSLTRNVSKDSLVFKYYEVIDGAKEYYEQKAQSVSGLKVIDKRTLQIKLVRPYPPFLSILAGASAKVTSSESEFSSKKLISSGPFVLQEDLGEKFVFARNSHYQGEKPILEQLVLQNVDQKTAIELAEKGLVHDLSAYPMNGTEDIFKKGQDISTVVADTWIIGLNTRHPPFNKIENRKAFQRSIDTEAFRKKFYPSAIAANGYIPEGFPGHKEDKKEIHLAEGIVAPKEEVVILIPNALEQANEMAKFLEADLTKNGWRAKVIPTDWSELMKGYNANTLQGFLVSMLVDFPEAEFLLSNFESTNVDNYSGIKDARIDSLLELSRKTTDRIKRAKIQSEAAELVDELALSVNLFHPTAHYWVSKCVSGFVPNPLAVTYINYRSIQLDSQCAEGKVE